MATKPRYVVRYLCNQDAPDRLDSWFVIDCRRGVPLADARGIRMFTRAEARAEIERRSQPQRDATAD